ncbi:MAG: YebC/PmpR family DNA-binding transcriptional regulator [Phycisphaerae bacterium]|nr:YebC/PmpR family DNA-binding transcriptional regulator [Phycisphaerae bacterium]MBM93106.1 YebC/PmpR family DNA-binding transcriptional regulator [Phycisphaerae bacterium]HCT43816.1 YebC/PmpR family DNA-binding transcriptional regulator [Phycisphaerales bacterium]|tara:strand:- start:1012 stop:1776 length:765 start_codon:yes stop_codon:yes gene_type:complete
MAGHSKWANIRHRKERQDKKKGKVWSKCSKAIMVAARAGGGDPETNLALRYAIDEAKYANMPKDTIKRAIEKGSGEAGGAEFQQIVYEGYGPGGTALIIDALTDNNTRTVGEVRSIFKKGGGSMGNAGTVAFMFTTKGQIFIDANKYDEDQVMDAALEAGADDVQAPEGDEQDKGAWTIVTDPTEFQGVKDAIEASGIEIVEAEITRLPENTVDVAGDDVRKVMNLIDALEDNDDIQKVYSNAEFDGDELAKLG